MRDLSALAGLVWFSSVGTLPFLHGTGFTLALCFVYVPLWHSVCVVVVNLLASCGASLIRASLFY